MIRMKALIFFLALTTQGAGAQTSHELAIKEATLKELAARTREIELLHGKLMVIRDARLAGGQGFHPQVERWFSDAASWMSSWETSIASLNGDALARPGALDAVKQEVQQQLAALESLRRRQTQIQQQGLEALQLLAALPRMKPGYVAGYDAAVSVLNAQLDNLQEQTSRSLELFDASSDDGMERIAGQLRELLTSKAALLSLRFPELEGVLREVESALATIEHVERAVEQVHAYTLQVRADFLAGRVYSAQTGLNSLRPLAAAASQEILAKDFIPLRLRQDGVARTQRLVVALEEEIRSQLAFSTAKQRFAAFYDRQMRARFESLITPCQASRPAKHLDCALLKSVAGFTTAQLLTMSDEQLAYVESVLRRVKEGPLHAPKQTGDRP